MSARKSDTYFFSRHIFLRLLGLIYLLAFISFWWQVEGLIGSNGILPASRFLGTIRRELGPGRFWIFPTLCWLNSSDLFLHFLCGLGVLFSVWAILGFRPWPVFLILWVLYLSLVVAGQDFMEFQWDNLLLEAGFLSVFFAKEEKVHWLLKWLLFRLMFSSAVVKLSSGDPAWQNLTALNFHYETQPLPTWIGWYFHQLPSGFHKLSVALMFMIEGITPFLIFMGRRLRLFACVALIFLQGLIAITGNYCFFNLLAVSLCVLLLDDNVWPASWWQGEEGKTSSPKSLFRWISIPFLAVILIVSGMDTVHSFRWRVKWPVPLILLYRAVSPFRTVNSYGLFAVMTQTRSEIIVEGSYDGAEWRAYEFKWKPGNPRRPPGFVAPHQPRLDWQMWFAALGECRQNPWVLNLLIRLMQGSSEVLSLLETNPFSGHPPRYIRTLKYDYHFTEPKELHSGGVWWRRESKKAYCPVLSQDVVT